MTLRDTITAFVHTRILPLGGKGTGDVPPSSPVPTNSAREQWIVDELRKVEGR